MQSNAYRADHADPLPRASITVDALYDQFGARWPLSAARSGDTITIRNLPLTVSSVLDRIRTFRISRASYDVDNDTLTVEPEAPLPTLDVLLARQAKGF